jgi:hypothetical protein
MFRSRRDELTGGCRNHTLDITTCTLHQIFLRMITSRRMECVRHAACMGEMRDALKF